MSPISRAICRIKKLYKKIPIVLSYSFLVFSAVTSMFLLIPTCCGKVPALSYLISEKSLPIVYEIHGRVIVLDENDEIIDKGVKIYVGGYSTELITENFELKFSAPATDTIFVVIQYEIDGKSVEVTKCLTVEKGVHVFNEEFIVYA